MNKLRCLLVVSFKIHTHATLNMQNSFISGTTTNFSSMHAEFIRMSPFAAKHWCMPDVFFIVCILQHVLKSSNAALNNPKWKQVSCLTARNDQLLKPLFVGGSVGAFYPPSIPANTDNDVLLLLLIWFSQRLVKDEKSNLQESVKWIKHN